MLNPARPLKKPWHLPTLWQDTLFARLFVLLWATLVLSHAVAFVVVTQLAIPLTRPGVVADGAHQPRPAVVFPSLPPAGGSASSELPARHDDLPGLPLPLLLLDYAIRLLVMGLGAWWGSRWLALPVKRLVNAAHAMGSALEQGQPPPPLDEKRGTVEAQQAATVFNRLATDLYTAFRSRELLFATVSHDLRTPMTRIRLRLESHPGPAEVAQCIADIAQMDELVRSALAMVRQSAGSQALQPTRIDALLQAVVDDYADMGQPLVWPEAQTTPPITALADPLALRRVLDNVIQNALRHASQVQLSLWFAPDTATVTIALEDDGPGMAESQLASLLAPAAPAMGLQGSVSGHGSAQAGGQGSGLGLYIAHDLMRLQGGSMVLTNRPEGGLRVEIRLQRNND